jgi:hypothetical protein
VVGKRSTWHLVQKRLKNIAKSVISPLARIFCEAEVALRQACRSTHSPVEPWGTAANADT